MVEELIQYLSVLKELNKDAVEVDARIQRTCDEIEHLLDIKKPAKDFKCAVNVDADKVIRAISEHMAGALRCKGVR